MSLEKIVVKSVRDIIVSVPAMPFGVIKGYCDFKGIHINPEILDNILIYAPTMVYAVATPTVRGMAMGIYDLTMGLSAVINIAAPFAQLGLMHVAMALGAKSKETSSSSNYESRSIDKKIYLSHEPKKSDKWSSFIERHQVKLDILAGVRYGLEGTTIGYGIGQSIGYFTR